MYCKNCGAQIDDNSRFCSHCGARQGLLDSPEPKPAQRPGGKFPVWILWAILFLVGIMLMAVVIPSALMALTGSAG